MFVTVKGKFLQIEQKEWKEEVKDYVKIWSEDDIVSVKLPEDWDETAYASLLALTPLTPIDIDVRLNLFNDKLYFTAVKMEKGGAENEE